MTTPDEVRSRLARWRGSGDPRDLWPGIDEREFLSAIREIGRVTRGILAGPSAEPIRLESPVTPRALGVAAFSSGMGPLLGYWVETGRIAAASDVASLLAEHLAQGRARAELLGRALGRVLDALEQRGVRAAVLKGMHTSLVYFPEPGTRPCADVDLLVAPDQYDAACAALADLKYRQGQRWPESPRSEWIAPAAPDTPRSLEMTHRDDPWAVDLHGSLDRLVRVGLRAGFGSPAPAEWDVIETEGRRILVLPQPLLLAGLAFHTASHLEHGPLVRLVELVLVMRRDLGQRPEIWRAFLALVERTGTARFVYPALELADRLAPGSVPLKVRDQLQRAVPWLMRRVVRRLQPETAQQLYRQSLDVQVMRLSSVGELMAYLRSLLRPPDAQSAERRRGFFSAQVRRLRLALKGRWSLRAPQ